MIRYLKQYKLLLFLTVLFTAISSLSYVFIAILLQQVMDIVDMGDIDGFIRILFFSLVYFALMGVFMYLQSLFSKKFICKIMKAVRSKTFMGIERHTIEDYSKNHTADYLSAITNDVKMIEDNYYKEKLTNFLNSSFISKYKDYKKYQEYEFLWGNSNKIYHGKIDLLLVGDSEALIIDYKLKNTKDKAYIDQLNGYKEVISNKLNLPTSCYLYSIIDEKFEKI